MKTVYIVQAEHGEYSDRYEWSVAVYADKEKALQHASLANQEANQLCEQAKELPYSVRAKLRNKYDPALYSCDGYEASIYSVNEVELRTEVPE